MTFEKAREMLLGDGIALENSIKMLARFLYKHYSPKVIILIDEYDVPLDKAFSNGYYEEMVELIRGLLGQALKTNDFLQFGILTGCLRVSKESIFTGINNFEVLSILDVRYDEGFGNTEVYCPWDVIRYCKSLCADSTAKPPAI